MTPLQSRIERLRAKPEHVRKQIAFWSAFGITFVIFGFWVASFGFVRQSASDAVASAVSKAGTPAESLTASVGGFFSDLKDLILSPRKVTFTDVEVKSGK